MATTPGDLAFEKYVTVTDTEGHKISIRTQCMGPANKTDMTDTVVLLEVGGGSSGIDMIGLQSNLSEIYTTCTYDRAGYGKSSISEGAQPKSSVKNIMYQAMNQIGFPINSKEKRVVCIGHSAGGQLCRYYAEELKSIKGIFLLDSMPVNRWAVLIAKNTSADV